MPTSRPRSTTPNPYMDYGKSYAYQGRGKPSTYSKLYAAGGGLTGATLAAMIAQAFDASPMATAGAAGAGGLLGGLVGHSMGGKERQSQNTRLNALKRFGIDNPAEYELMLQAPLAGKKVVDQGVYV